MSIILNSKKRGKTREQFVD